MTTALESTVGAAPSKALRIGLWVAQCLGGLAFGMAGTMKLATPVDQLAARMAWVSHFPPIAVKLIGTAEVLGAVGLILPSLLRIAPKLTVAAAIGLVMLMVGGAGTHVVIHDTPHIAASLVLGALAAFVAWGRSTRAPITSR